MEYADGKKFPLQDYVNGGPNGELYLLVSDEATYTSDECNFGGPKAAGIPSVQTNPCRNQTLFIGMRLPRPKDVNGNPLHTGGIVTLWLDARRNDTLNLVSGSNVPRAEDRRIQLRYSTSPSSTSSLSQLMGDGVGAWVALTSTSQTWSTVYSVDTPAADPNWVHLEFSVRLKPNNFLLTSSEPLSAAVRKLGLGIQVVPNSVAGAVQKVGGGSLPNGKSAMPSNLMPSTWETLEFKDPDPIPMSFSVWNVGQMPDVTFWVPDGGSGEIDTVAQKIYKKEVACITEIWMSHERGELIEKVNALRAAESLHPMQAVTELNDELLRPPTESTGLVLLSSRQILAGGVHHFPSSMCTGNDCMQDKGVLWARIATPSATKPVISMDVTGAPKLATGTDYAEFVDVFCTHVNAGDNVPGPDTDAREDQFFDIRAYVQQVRQGGPLHVNSWPYVLGDADVFPQGTWPSGMDRPAFLLGDLNTLGPKQGQADASFPAYGDMMGANFLAISERTEFEKANSTFSEARDLGRAVSGADPKASGTWLSSTCSDNVENELSQKDRIDYILVFPPEDSTAFPTFALLKEPTASVHPHFDPDSGSQCLSDHAMVDASVSLARVKDVVKYNPAKKHRVEYSINQVTDLETASGCCADWYTPRVFMSANGSWRENAFWDIVEDQTIYPGWSVRTGPSNPTNFPDLPSGHTGTVSMTSSMWEWDHFGNDHYDSIPEGGASVALDDRDGHFTFSAGSGAVKRVQGETPATDWTLELEFLGNFQDGYESGITVETEGGDAQTENNARVRHHILVKELDEP
jgi:hypothetical protein